MKVRTLVTLPVLVSLSLTLAAATAFAADVRIAKVDGPPALQRFLAEQTWARAIEITDFRQREPGDGVEASQATTAYLAYDEQNLYVVFVCKDERAKVRAHYLKREDIAEDDQVVVYLDTFHDRQRAYMFAANPLGVQLDGILTEGQDLDVSFDTLWRSDASLTEDGYVVSMSIPFKSLRFSSLPVQNWGIALGRILVRNNEEAYWPHITKRVEGFVPQFATVFGFSQISPGRNLQLIPHGIFADAQFLDDEAAVQRRATDVTGGLDAKAVFRDALALDVTANPDFSQVESDEPQVTVNQRFEVFFPEKRPFFLENAGFFQTPINLFHSRRVVDPQVGGRLTGKLDRWALGTLLIDDEAPGRGLPLGDALRDRRAMVGVVGVRREFGDQSSAGLLLTNRSLDSSFNRVGGVDLRLKLSKNWVLAGQAVASQTEETDGTRLNGPAYFFELGRDGRHFDYAGRYVDISPDFRSELGFIERTDIRLFEQEIEYNWRPKDSALLKFGPEIVTQLNWNHDGRIQDKLFDAVFNFEFPGTTKLSFGRAEAYELFEGVGFRKHRTSVGFETRARPWLGVAAAIGFGTNINFDPGEDLAPYEGDEIEGELKLVLFPFPRLRLEGTYLYNRMRTNESSGVAPAGTPIFTNHILRSKLSYQFSRALSIRAILDYESVLPNLSLVDVDDERHFAVDLLATYQLNPWTAFYVGYTDSRENFAIIESENERFLRRTGSPTLSTGRQFFVKVSYLWRF